MKHSILTSLVILSACTSSPLDPGAGDDPGTGTSTLAIAGSAVASPQLANAVAASDFATAFSVRVALGDTPVTTGTVTVTSSRGATALTFATTGNDTGHWVGTAAGYDEVYQLDVVSGADKIEGVIVDGPDIQVITAPTAGATLDPTMPFVATWDRADAADVARIDAGDADAIDVPDAGTYSVAAGTLHADQDRARTNTFRLTRTNQIAPKGALPESRFSVSVETEVDVVASPCPSC